MNTRASFPYSLPSPAGARAGAGSPGGSLEGTSGGSLAGVLRRQHARIAGLLSRVLDASGQPQPALPALVRYVALHEAAEQSFLHPAALAGAARNDAGDAVQSRLEEEREIGACFDRLGAMSLDSPDFMIQFGLLEEAVLDNCRAEEQAELPALSRTANGEDLDRIARGLGLVDEWYEQVEPADPATDERPPRYAELYRRGLHAFGSVSRLLF